MLRAVWAGIGAAAGIAAVAACGSREPVATGGWMGGAPGDTAAAADAGIDLAGAWPKADPGGGTAPTGGPTFGDGGAPPPSAVHCTGKTLGPGDGSATIQSAGGTRDYFVHVPPSYDPTAGAMLVVNYHGFSSNAPEEVILARMNAVADARGFIVVYPDGVAASWNAGDCCGVGWTNSVDDVQFTRDLVAKIESDYCVDKDRVYATGMSNGGFMAHRLGCAASDIFAAIAPVAGVLGIDPATCTPPRAVPVLDFHGTADPIVPYAGGTPVSPVDLGSTIPISFRSVDTTIGAWRSIDRCVGDTTKIYAQGDATCLEFSGCAEGASVVQCTIDGGGHTWPGGVPVPTLGYTSMDISATDTMIDFFVAHPMTHAIH
jgi:polyhydroxybutyrate depolymerase